MNNKANQTSFKKGHFVSEETRRKMSESHKGKIPWNKGKKGIIPWNKGKHLSEEYRKKISEALKGRSSWNKGKHFSEEDKKKMSEAKKKNPVRYWLGKKRPNLHSEEFKIKMRLQKGEKHWNWKGGVTPESERVRKSVELKEWKRACLRRDNFTCKKCGQYGGNLEVHHINNFAEFPELRTAIDNGITLCENCHLDFHKKYGFTNNTKEQLEEFMGQKLNSIQS